ncbi:MAG: pyruvoyl-dependent arginine decarboxylase [Candidatus Heimdallarchaeota archaeon]
MENHHRVISIVKATGTGATNKSSLDAALLNANIHNFNLIPLSSVIPPNVAIKRRKQFHREPLPGSMQPVVIARITSSEPGERISAGIGWKLAHEGGIFVEVACRESEPIMMNELAAGVREIASHRKWQWIGAPEYETVEISVPTDDKCATALVCAIYEWVQVWGDFLGQKIRSLSSSDSKRTATSGTAGI